MGTTARDAALKAAALARNAQTTAATPHEKQMAEAVESLPDAVAKIGFQLHDAKSFQLHDAKMELHHLR